jgi:nicotinamidase-related amidase
VTRVWVQALAAALRWTLRTAVHGDDDVATAVAEDGSRSASMTTAHRDALQWRALGTLAVFMIDKAGRKQVCVRCWL